MLLSIDDVKVLSKCTKMIGNDKYIAKDGISAKDKKKLESINELSEISCGEKMIENI